MIFKRAVQRYGRTPLPETPFQRAGQLWDERIGSARVQARNWRLMAFGCLGLTCALSAGLLWQGLQSRVVPYVVEVDRLGEARAVAAPPAGAPPPQTPDGGVRCPGGSAVRAISLDPVLMRADWLSAYDFTTRRGAVFLGDYARAADPFGHVGTRTISVQITSVVRASDKSFQVKWIETVFERGSEVGVSHWTAILTLVTAPPTTADRLRKNPLGIYVDAIDWSRELEPAGTGSSSSAPAASASTSSAPSNFKIPANLPLGSPLDPNLARFNNPENQQ